MAYEMTTLPGEGGGGVDDHEYEVIGRGRGNTHTATQGDEGLYEIPSSVTQYPPTPPPLPEATPTSENVGVANEGKNTTGDA